MNGFDRQRIEGIRDGALAVYNAMKDRNDVPEDVKRFALEVVQRAADRGSQDSLAQLGISTP